jgi:hypothetical protein
VGKLATPAYPAGHQFRLYFNLGSTWSPGASGDEENWRINIGGSPVGSVNALVDNVFDRLGGVLKEDSSITQLELWESAVGENTLVHLNTLPSGNNYGTNGGGVASSYWMYVFGTSLREQFRFTVFDGTNGDPQKFAPDSVPDTDDGSAAWMFLKSAYPLANNDGIRLTRMVSKNTGYNRKLARSYGRTVSP